MKAMEKKLKILEPYQEIKDSIGRLNKQVTLIEAKVDLLSSAPRNKKEPPDWKGREKKVPHNGYYEVLIPGERYRVCRAPYGWRNPSDEIMKGVRDFLVNNFRKDPYVIITGIPLLQSRFRPFCAVLFNEISGKRQKKFQVILISKEGLQAEMRKTNGGSFFRWTEPESHNASRIQEVIQFLHGEKIKISKKA